MLSFIALPSFSLGAVLGGVACYLAGCFTPAIGRKVKGLFVKEAAKVKADVGAVAQDVAKKL